ncbi:MAG TPA: bifunctional diaminohydroxyphosphoribosylaminopyrimidine deaminase/5-amino-6-(5-phosphoribosylamino)uracil reductase RibD, partial [Egibacteraceae bacterium]|nr:bifunctional diaminohydroxyphosphoribosylaminopyrimidine deaminase/5-amino-6-(5-phosphoribosylamino)uracil reductase RibD [Egibacteraceae bacterium]
CTQALIAAGVRRVVAAAADPHPTAGGGAARLRAAGVAVDVGLCVGEARRQNEAFFHGVASGRPFVIVKAATSLDGRIAAADGASQWLTGEQARARGHALRAEVDAVVVGSGTVLADDPAMTCRLSGHRGPQPLRVVLDGRGRTRADRRVVDAAAPTLVLSRSDADAGWAAALRDGGAEVADLAPGPEGGVDLHAALALLWERGVRSVLVEGGAAVLSAFLREQLCDKLVVHLAPLLLGAGGLPLAPAGPTSLVEALPLRLDSVERVGEDVILTLYPTTGARRRVARGGAQAGSGRGKAA